jgi:hypothetical protein
MAVMGSPQEMKRRNATRYPRARAAVLIAAAAVMLGAGCGRAVPPATGSHPAVFQPIGPFYQPPRPLPPGAPGQLIRDEPMAAPAGFRAWRILYHSRSVAGADIPVSGFVVIASRPAPAAGRPVLAYAHGVRGLANICAPSNTTQPLAAIQEYAPMLKAGAAVVATDYPGLGAPGSHPYLVGESEARSVLDAVRAAQRLPALGLSSDLVVFGDTQGGQAALFTGQIASRYAPELHLLGIAAEDPPTNLIVLERHAATTPFAAESLLEAAAGYSAAHPSADLRIILTRRGLTDLGLLRRECDDQFGKATAGQSIPSVFASNPLTTPPWSTGLAAGAPGAVRTPAPILIVQGSADQVYRASTTASFVQHICALGDTVDYRTYSQIGHAVTIAAASGIITWITSRLARRPAPSTCRK